MNQEIINDYHLLCNYFDYVFEDFKESVANTFGYTNEVWDVVYNAKRDLSEDNYVDIVMFNMEYKKFKRRLYYLKQKEKLQQDKQKLNLLSKSNLLCDDIILYKIAPFLNNFFKV